MPAEPVMSAVQTKNRAARTDDPAADIVRFVTVVKKGRYTLEEFSLHFQSTLSDPLNVLRSLIDEGRIPPPCI